MLRSFCTNLHNGSRQLLLSSIQSWVFGCAQCSSAARTFVSIFHYLQVQIKLIRPTVPIINRYPHQAKLKLTRPRSISRRKSRQIVQSRLEWCKTDRNHNVGIMAAMVVNFPRSAIYCAISGRNLACLQSHRALIAAQSLRGRQQGMDTCYMTSVNSGRVHNKSGHLSFDTALWRVVADHDHVPTQSYSWKALRA